MSSDASKTISHHENFQTILKRNFKKRVIYLENDTVFIMNNDTMTIIKKELIVGCTINKNIYIHLKNMPPIEISMNGTDHNTFGLDVISFIFHLIDTDSKTHDFYT